MRGAGHVLLVLGLLAAGFGRASAQPGVPTIVSVDAAVLNSEYVFVGRIERVPPEAELSSAANAVAKVELRLKGEVSDVTQTVVSAPRSALKAWKRNGSRLLFIDGAQPIELSSSNPMVFTAQSVVLRSPERVIQAARDVIRQHLGVTRISTCAKPIPSSIASQNNFWGTTALMVPADEVLEKWAIRELRAKAPEQRGRAASILRHFPCDANVARLRKLLADPGYVLCRTTPGGPDRRCYIVRKCAYETLTAWGLKPEEPEFYK